MKGLLDEGFAGLGGLAQGGVVGGDDAPAEEFLAFLDDDVFKHFFAGAALVAVAGQEDHADAVIVRGREGDFFLAADLLEEGVGDLHEDARAVAGVGFAAAGAAMVEIDEDGDGVADDLVGFLALDVDDKADPAGLMFKLRVVKTLLGRPTGRRSRHFLWRTHRRTLTLVKTHFVIFYPILAQAQQRSENFFGDNGKNDAEISLTCGRERA